MSLFLGQYEGRVAIADMNVDAGSLEGVGFARSQHFDLQSRVILANVANNDSHVENGFAVAFQRPLEGACVHIDRVLYRFVPLLSELNISLAMLVDRLATNAGTTRCERNGIG